MRSLAAGRLNSGVRPMWKLIACLALLLVSSRAIGAAPHCDPLDETVRLSGPNLSLSELEAIGLSRAASNPKAPQVPWAYGNKNWLFLKALYRPGDQIRAYEQLWRPSGKPFAWGYALVRGQCVLGVLTTRIS
jgi:hypothetical protein